MEIFTIELRTKDEVNTCAEELIIHCVSLLAFRFNYPAPENGVRTYNSFPLDTVLHTEFQPL